MEFINSKDNKIIKYCGKLVSDKEFRLLEKKVFVEGFRLSYDAYRSGVVMEYLLVTQDALDKWPQQLQEIIDTAVHTLVIDDKIAKHIADTKTFQGVFAVCQMPNCKPSKEGIGTYLLLDKLQDPGNVGTIIRCGEAFGITQIILSKGCVDIWSPKVIRSSMGSVFRQSVTIVDDMPAQIEALKKDDVIVYGAMLEDTAVTPKEMRQGEKGIAVVVGNEGNGITKAVLDSCSQAVYIPMTAQIESLNVAAATTILIWEMVGKN